MNTNRLLGRSSIFLSLLLAFSSYVNAAVKGSESVVSVEPFYTFPSADSDNKMLGFGWFKNGFALEDESTSCTFDSAYPVSGNISLTGGSIYLDMDLVLRDEAQWVGAGKLYAKKHLVDFSPSVTVIGSVAYEQLFDNAKVRLNDDIVISGSVKFSGDCLFDGNCKNLILDSNGYLLVDSNTTVTLKNVTINGLSGEKICCLDDTGKIVFDSVTFLQDGNFSFKHGSFKILNLVDFVGSYTFSYESGRTSTISENSNFHVQDLRFKVQRNSGAEPIYFDKASSILHLDNCTLNVGANGCRFTKGQLLCDHEIFLEVDSTNTTNGIALGNGNVADDLKLIIQSGSTLHFVHGHIVYDIVNSTGFISKGGGAKLIRYGGTTFFVNQDIDLYDLVIVDKNLTVAIEVADGKTVRYSNVSFEWSGVGLDVSGYRLNFYTNLLAGGDELFLLKGVLPSYLIIQGSDNIIHGGGSLSGQIILSGPSASLQFKLYGSLLEDVVLNGGTAYILTDLKFDRGYKFSGSGNVNLGSSCLELGPSDQSWGGAINWVGTGGQISLNSKIELTSTWTFNGNCTIVGNGNEIELRAGGAIVVGSGSSLNFRDIKMEGVSENNIRCVDNTASINMNSTSWVQKGDYSFNYGSMSFENNNNFDGEYTLSYESNQTSTIRSDSSLRMGNKIKCVMGKRPEEGALEPLYFEDSTSVLKFSNCSLLVTNSGVKITKGSVAIERDVFFDINSTDSLNGLIFGDGTSEGDSYIKFYPGASLFLRSGAVVSNVTDPVFMNPNQDNVYLACMAGSILYISQNLHLENLRISTDFNSRIVMSPGKTLSYNNCSIVTDIVSFLLTGIRGAEYLSVLDGNGDLSIQRGTLPVVTYVLGANNYIGGNGNIAGPIVLQDSATELSVNLNGYMSNNIIMGGGKLSLEGDFGLTSSNVLTGSGKVELRGNDFILGTLDKVWPGSIYWDGSDGRIQMNSNVSLAGTWTFSGVCVINGNWNILILDPQANIVVERGSTLIFKETKIKNLSGNKIRCLDDSSTVRFYNSRTMLDGDYSFTCGRMEIVEEFEVNGTNTFTLASSKQCYIDACSTFRMMEGTTLSYSPPIADKTLLNLSCVKSTLELNGATLHTTTTGPQLTCGRVIINGDCFIVSDAEVPGEGVIFGNGVDSVKNLCVDVMPNAHLKIKSGYVVDRNVRV